MKIAVGADHAGFEMKNDIKAFLELQEWDVIDLGAHEYAPLDDYPDFAFDVAEAVKNGDVERGILICGSGIGASVAANKVVGVRAGLCAEPYSAHQGVEHDDMNIVVLGSRVTGIEVAKEIVNSFLKAEFTGETRHVRRLNKVLQIEAESLAGGSLKAE